MNDADARYLALQNRRNSFLYWFGVPIKVNVPTPKSTIYVPANPSLAEWSGMIADGCTDLPDWIGDLRYFAPIVGGYPLIVRTDQTAGKHNFAETCYIKNEDFFGQNLYNLLLYQRGQIGTPEPELLALREYLEPASIIHGGKELAPFLAFGRASRMPVRPERRYFVRDGKVECHHPYWPSSEIKGVDPSASDWEARLAAFNNESDEEVALLSEYAVRMASMLHGYWSLDFMWGKRKDGEPQWFFIDAALGDCSQHWDCPFAPVRRH